MYLAICLSTNVVYVLRVWNKYLLPSLPERSARVMHLGLFVCMSIRTRNSKTIDMIFYTSSITPPLRWSKSASGSGFKNLFKHSSPFGYRTEFTRHQNTPWRQTSVYMMKTCIMMIVILNLLWSEFVVWVKSHTTYAWSRSVEADRNVAHCFNRLAPK